MTIDNVASRPYECRKTLIINYTKKVHTILLQTVKTPHAADVIQYQE